MNYAICCQISQLNIKSVTYPSVYILRAYLNGTELTNMLKPVKWFVYLPCSAGLAISKPYKSLLSSHKMTVQGNFFSVYVTQKGGDLQNVQFVQEPRIFADLYIIIT